VTKNPEVRFAKSIVDYIFRWMATKFLSSEAQFEAGVNQLVAPEGQPVKEPKLPLDQTAGNGSGERVATLFAAIQNHEDAPPCSTCGEIMVRSGSCYKCNNCGSTSGCA
jgi:ribonucleoside-diphosphate reductase alpha chain